MFGLMNMLVGIGTFAVLAVGAWWLLLDSFANKLQKEATARLLDANAKLALEQAAKVAAEARAIDAQTSITIAQAHMWQALSVAAVPATIFAGVIVCSLLGVLAYVAVRTVPLWITLLNLKIQNAQLALQNQQTKQMPRPQRRMNAPSTGVIQIDDNGVIDVVPVAGQIGQFVPIVTPSTKTLAAPPRKQLTSDR